MFDAEVSVCRGETAFSRFRDKYSILLYSDVTGLLWEIGCIGFVTIHLFKWLHICSSALKKTVGVTLYFTFNQTFLK